MKPKPRWFSDSWRLAAMLALLLPVIIRGQSQGCNGQGCSFFTLDPAYAQHLFGVTASFLKTPPDRGYLGGVVVLQNGDVIAAECETSVTRLHRFIASSTYTDPQHGTTLHPESISDPIPGGCGITLHPDGYLYSNMFEGASGFGVARIDLTTGDVTRMGPPGNALGIAVDPITTNLVYAGQGCKPAFGAPPCELIELDPATGLVIKRIDTSQFGYIDGLAFDPTGTYLFLTNRCSPSGPLGCSVPTFELVVLKRIGGPPDLVQRVPMTSEPVGIGFHAASPKFVVTNNQDGTMTRFDFPGDDYTLPPTSRDFAMGGFRGDLMQAGPDGCLYLTQDGARYDDGEPGGNTENSIVQICDGFAPPPGVPAPRIALVKRTNGTDNDSGTGPLVAVGSQVTWTYVVTNTGNVDLLNVAVTDNKVGAITCPTATLAVGASMTCTATGTTVAGQYTNIGFVTAMDSAGKTVSAQNADHYFGVVPPSADLGIAVSAPATVVAGTTLNYTLNAFNNGTFSARDATVIHSVPSTLKFVSMSRPPGWSCITPAPGGAGTITCTKSSMAVAETASFSIALGSSCPLPNAGPVTLAATISSSTPDPNPRNNASIATTAIVNPAPVISKARVSPSTMWPPNHKMQNVRVDYTVSSGCGGIVTTRLNVASNERTNGADWEILDAHTLRLRSERNGGGNGRVYTIFIIATDPTTGISTTNTVQVTVVHDQGNGKR
jgi:uncharacterized repeat protein (TIGR01451 family)